MSEKFRYSIGEMTIRLLKITEPVKGKLLVSTLASIIGNLSQMGLMGFGALALLACSGRLEGKGFSFYLGFMAFSAFLIVLCRYVEGLVSHAGAYALLAHMRIHLFETIRRLAPACLVDREKGDILNIAVSDIETIEFFFAHTIGPMFTVILLPCTSLLIALLVHPLYAAVLLPIYLVVSVVFPLLAVQAGRSIGVRYRTRLGKLKSLVLESVYGLKDIQIFGFGPARLQMIQEKNREVNAAAHGLTLHRQTVSSAPSFFVYLARIAVIAAAAHLVGKGVENPAGTVLISFLAAASFSSTQSLTTVVSSLLETYAAAERLFLLEDTVPEVTEPENPQEIGPIKTIEFEHVDFWYDAKAPAGSRPADGKPALAACPKTAADLGPAGSQSASPEASTPERQILKDFCLTLSGNEHVGIVGESGIGKSTILRLLLRFWNPKGGRIRINGIPIEELSLSELHRRIAVLEQDTFLFDGTIGENIALGKPDASREEIVQAARRAGIHDFIHTLPQGYDTPMGTMGARLSGGEKQRIGIARTMLTDPDVIVMDEPTSSLDVLHEKELLKTLADECGAKMVLLVSHRPSTLTGCSRIIRLAGGKAVSVS